MLFLMLGFVASTQPTGALDLLIFHQGLLLKQTNQRCAYRRGESDLCRR